MFQKKRKRKKKKKEGKQTNSSSYNLPYVARVLTAKCICIVCKTTLQAKVPTYILFVPYLPQASPRFHLLADNNLYLLELGLLYRSLPEKPHCTLLPYLIYWGYQHICTSLPLHQTSSSDLILTSPHNYIHQEEKKVFEKKKEYETRYPTTPLSSSPSSQPLLFNPPSPLPPTPTTAATHCRFSLNAQWNPL